MADAEASGKTDTVKDVPPKTKAVPKPAQNPVFKMMGMSPDLEKTILLTVS